MMRRGRLSVTSSHGPSYVYQLQGSKPYRNAQGDVHRNQGHGHSGEVLQISDTPLQKGQEQKRFERLLHPAMRSSMKQYPKEDRKRHGHEN